MPRGAGSSRAWLTALLMAVPTLGAQVPLKEPSDSSDGIAGAKRELEAVKAASVPGANPTGRTLPVLDFPTLTSSTNDAPVRPPLDPARRPDARPRTGDWVLPETNDRSRLRGGGAAVGAEGRSNRDGAPFTVQRRDSNAIADPGSEPTVNVMPRDISSLKPVNPLAPFLSGWISAQDFRLLTAVRDPDRNPAPAPATDGAGRVAPLSEGIQGGIPSEPRRGGSPAAGARFDAPVATGNPYLEAFASVPPPTSTLPPTPKSMPPTPAALASPPMTPTATDERSAQPSRVPDFVRSTADEKYFKPLKRF